MEEAKLTVTEIQDIVGIPQHLRNDIAGDVLGIERAIAQAQLDKAEPLIRANEREGLIKELEAIIHLQECDPDNEPYYTPYYWIDKEEWQALKEGE